MADTQTPEEPTLSDIVTALNAFRLEVRTGMLEVRASVAEVRANLSDFRLATYERFDDLRRHLDLLTDALAEFRSEYTAHTYGESA